VIKRTTSICWIFWLMLLAPGLFAAGRLRAGPLDSEEMDRFEQCLHPLESRVQRLPSTARAAVLKSVTVEVRYWIADARRLSALRRSHEQEFQFWFLRRLINGTLVSLRTHLAGMRARS
jgi:hypothetical protein